MKKLKIKERLSKTYKFVRNNKLVIDEEKELNCHQRWPLGYGREITYWWGTYKSSKTVKMLAK